MIQPDIRQVLRKDTNSNEQSGWKAQALGKGLNLALAIAIAKRADIKESIEWRARFENGTWTYGRNPDKQARFNRHARRESMYLRVDLESDNVSNNMIVQVRERQAKERITNEALQHNHSQRNPSTDGFLEHNPNISDNRDDAIIVHRGRARERAYDEHLRRGIENTEPTSNSTSRRRRRSKTPYRAKKKSHRRYSIGSLVSNSTTETTTDVTIRTTTTVPSEIIKKRQEDEMQRRQIAANVILLEEKAKAAKIANIEKAALMKEHGIDIDLFL